MYSPVFHYACTIRQLTGMINGQLVNSIVLLTCDIKGPIRYQFLNRNVSKILRATLSKNLNICSFSAWQRGCMLIWLSRKKVVEPSHICFQTWHFLSLICLCHCQIIKMTKTFINDEEVEVNGRCYNCCRQHFAGGIGVLTIRWKVAHKKCDKFSKGP